MAYAKSGSTSGANPPLLVGDQPIAGPKNWVYISTDTRAVAVSSTHITDGKALGMKVGDNFYCHETDTSGVYGSTGASSIARTSYHRVTAVNSTWVTLNVGTLISSAS